MLRTLLSVTMLGSAFAATAAPTFNSNPDEIARIGTLLEEFRQDILRKDGPALTRLMLHPNVLFHSIDDQESVDSARRLNAQFDGVGPSALDGFVKLLATSKDKLEERFQNIEIRQDGDLGLVTCTTSSSTTRFIIRASSTGRSARSTGNGRSCR